MLPPIFLYEINHIKDPGLHCRTSCSLNTYFVMTDPAQGSKQNPILITAKSPKALRQIIPLDKGMVDGVNPDTRYGLQTNSRCCVDGVWYTRRSYPEAKKPQKVRKCTTPKRRQSKPVAPINLDHVSLDTAIDAISIPDDVSQIQGFVPCPPSANIVFPAAVQEKYPARIVAVAARVVANVPAAKNSLAGSAKEAAKAGTSAVQPAVRAARKADVLPHELVNDLQKVFGVEPETKRPRKNSLGGQGKNVAKTGTSCLQAFPTVPKRAKIQG